MATIRPRKHVNDKKKGKNKNAKIFEVTKKKPLDILQGGAGDETT